MHCEAYFITIQFKELHEIILLCGETHFTLGLGRVNCFLFCFLFLFCPPNLPCLGSVGLHCQDLTLKKSEKKKKKSFSWLELS